jgi:quinol monooxygenase YgiN
MSVIVTVRVKGDPSRLEEFVRSDPDRIRAVSEASKPHGVIAHRFYGSDDGEILVIDEWPDAASFQRFFEEQQRAIGSVMQDVGVTSAPEVSIWRKLETHDEIGWE